MEPCKAVLFEVELTGRRPLINANQLSETSAPYNFHLFHFPFIVDGCLRLRFDF
jgi:hypothetical protein